MDNFGVVFVVWWALLFLPITAPQWKKKKKWYVHNIFKSILQQILEGKLLLTIISVKFFFQ